MEDKELFKKSKTHILDYNELKNYKEDRIKLGVCAMSKKIKCKHMKAILDGLEKFNEFEIIIFTEEIIFNKEIEDWPIVDALIIFFSKGFPFTKGKTYIDLRKPFLINDFNIQSCFWDRRKVLKMLHENQIPTPKHLIVDRGEEINNDGENLLNKLESSDEIEKMVNDLKEDIEKFNSPDEVENDTKNPKMELNNFNSRNSSTYVSNNNNLSNSNIINLHKTNSNFSFKNSADCVDCDNNLVLSDEKSETEEKEYFELINNLGEIKDFNFHPTKFNFSIDKEEIDEIKDKESELYEYDDYIEYKGQKMYKPFVEKPCNGDDHNIYIYYPPSHGGGVKHLFRKTKDLCSLFVPYENKIRRDKSYIYEEFLQTDGFDIKVYTVGPEYAHAEARKSPTLDGKVKRGECGKEVRYPINLTPEEKEIARKIVNIFKQNVCGFDILRARGKSYVCDINGWSFVKDNKKYVEDCTLILRKIILQKLNKKLYLMKPISLIGGKIYQDLQLPSSTYNSMSKYGSNYIKSLNDDQSSNFSYDKNNKNVIQYAEELRSVVAIFRHADRSPKQKMKLIIVNKELLELYEKFGTIHNDYGSSKSLSNILTNKPSSSSKKLSRKNTLKIIEEKNNEIIDHSIFDEDDDKIPKFNEVKLKKPKELMEVLLIVHKILDQNKLNQPELKDVNDNFILKLFQIKMVLEKNLNFEGMTRKIQLKPLEISVKQLPHNKKKYYVSKALMILKWGGNLTHAGVCQAKLLGNTFRVRMYPSSLGDNNGLLRLHNTYRHDLKAYSSEEGRCLKTAGAFLQGLLELDGPMIPIITSLVRKDDIINKSLDVPSDVIIQEKNDIKREICECLNYNGPLVDKFNILFKDKDIDNLTNDKYKCEKMTNSDDKPNLDKKPIEINEENKSCNVKSFPSDSDSNSSLVHLMENIDNPYQRMETILKLMDSVIEHLKTSLSQKEIDLECSSYFIKMSSSIKTRKSEQNSKTQKNSINVISSKNTPKSPSHKSSLIIIDSKKSEKNGKEFRKSKRNKSLFQNDNSKEKSSNDIVHRSKETSPADKDNSCNSSFNNSNLNNSFYNNYFDCEEEKSVLIFKRYIKLRNDFFNQKTKQFDTTKIPDIYDNIKYDLIHNRHILNDDAYLLYSYINPLANFVMSLEYGITLNEKLIIGKKVVKPLLNKIYKDLIWWNFNNSYIKSMQKQYDEQEISYSGLDQEKLGDIGIKSKLRHVKTRLYFVCASHIYTLINLLIYGCNSFLLDMSENNKKAIKELKNIFYLYYCSHIVFRLYENFNVEENDPKRFRLEIIMSPGSDKDPKDVDRNHLMSVSPWIVLNNNLTLEQLKEFFLNFEKRD